MTPKKSQYYSKFLFAANNYKHTFQFYQVKITETKLHDIMAVLYMTFICTRKQLTVLKSTRWSTLINDAALLFSAYVSRGPIFLIKSYNNLCMADSGLRFSLVIFNWERGSI